MSGDEFLRSRDLHENAAGNLTEALRNAVANRFGEYGWEECAELAERILRQHAHELAEKIRSASACYRGSNDCGDPDCVGRMAAADLIDPEVADG